VENLQNRLQGTGEISPKLRPATYHFVAIVEIVGNQMPALPPEQPRTPDSRRSLFWIFVSFMGISLPKPGQEAKAMRMLIIGVILFVGFFAAGIFTLFRLW